MFFNLIPGFDVLANRRARSTQTLSVKIESYFYDKQL